MSATPRSPLLDALDWVDYAFQPAGEPPPDDAAYAHQLHSAVVLTDTHTIPPKSGDADGVIATGHRPVAVYTADCLPVLFADSQQKQVAAVHAGLQGTLAGVLYRAVAHLCERGATPASLTVAIGPALAPCCFELDRQRLAEIEQMPDMPLPLRYYAVQPHNPGAQRPQAVATRGGVWFDLPYLATQMLIKAGIPAENIDPVHQCTYCTTEAGSSYRFNTHHGSGYRSRYSWIRRR
ncbi:polyphenol oxidase family protein [Pantoea sp. CS_6]|uniref:polyphenol oxidase family protein n=1 Tax=Pantoea sp. CS_6 TaxID=3055795 RepID=UPI0035C171BC